MSTTRLQLYQDVATILEGDLLSGTATGGSTTTLVDSSGDSPLDPDDEVARFDNAYVYLHTGTGAGEERRIKRSGGYTPASGTLNFSSDRAWTSAVDATSQYHVLRRMSHARIVDCINRVLRELFYRCRLPLTLVTDGDMEASGVTSWTASNSTLTKETTAANVWSGAQSLKMVTGGANGYVKSAAVAVNENETYSVEVHAKATTNTTLSLIVTDVTNSATISVNGQATWDGTDGNDWVRLWAIFTVPDNCRSIQVFLQDSGNGTTSYWDDLILVNTTRRQIPAPSWLADGVLEQVLWGTTGFQPNPGQRHYYPVLWHRYRREPNGANPDVVEWEGAQTYALFAEGLRRYAELATDAATTPADREMVKRGTLREAYLELMSPAGADQSVYKEQYAYWAREFERSLAEHAVRPHLRLQLRPF